MAYKVFACIIKETVHTKCINNEVLLPFFCFLSFVLLGLAFTFIRSSSLLFFFTLFADATLIYVALSIYAITIMDMCCVRIIDVLPFGVSCRALFACLHPKRIRFSCKVNKTILKRRECTLHNNHKQHTHLRIHCAILVIAWYSVVRNRFRVNKHVCNDALARISANELSPNS